MAANSIDFMLPFKINKSSKISVSWRKTFGKICLQGKELVSHKTGEFVSGSKFSW
jgi:hypothetical protein